MLNEADEVAISKARAAKRRQNKDIPFLIHTDDARLIPNTELTRKHKKYIPYMGGIHDDLPTRQQFLKFGQRRRVVNSAVETEVFDVGVADADALVLFALDEYGAVLQAATPIKTLRKQVMKLAEVAGQAAPATAVAPPKPTGLSAATATVTADDLSE